MEVVNEQLKLLYIRDEFAKIEFNFESLINEITNLEKDKNLYDNLSKIDCELPNKDIYFKELSKKQLELNDKIVEFIRIKIPTFSVQLDYVYKCLIEVQNDYSTLDILFIKQLHISIVNNYVMSIVKIKNILKTNIDNFKIDPNLYKNIPARYERNSLPHKQIDDTILYKIMLLEKISIFQYSIKEQYFDLFLNSESMNFEEYEIKKNELNQSVFSILYKIDELYTIFQTEYDLKNLNPDQNQNKNLFSIRFLIRKILYIKKCFTIFIN
jgi:hypothetical protein